MKRCVRDLVFTSMLEKLLNDYRFVPSLRPVNLRDMDKNRLDEQIINSTVTRVGGSKVVFGRLVKIKDQEYIIVSQTDNYRIIHYIKHSLEIIRGLPQPQNELFGVPKYIVDEIYALSPGSLENMKRRFNKVLCDLHSSELEADNLWPNRHELRIV
jgi:hypothetical protein